ncbi:MAG: DUF4123 domain-containing protein [Pseudomonadota bacterium]
MTRPPTIPEHYQALQQACVGQGRLYALMDGAMLPELEASILEHQPPLAHMPLLLGDAVASFASISPRLIHLPRDAALTWWLLDEGIRCGIYLCSRAEMSALHHHLYSLTAVRTQAGDKVQFRYYEPAILHDFWPSLTAAEQNALLGPIDRLIVPQPDTTTFSLWDRPTDHKQLPYPPAPDDWTQLPEPWWQLTMHQTQALQTGSLEHFLQDFANHLAEMRDLLHPDYTVDFHSFERMRILRIQANYLMNHGFETDYDLASVLEQVQVFNLRLDSPKVQTVIENTKSNCEEKMRWLKETTQKDNKL